MADKQSSAKVTNVSTKVSMTVLEILEYIPEAAWSRVKDIATFCGALLAFLGILLQISNNAKQARKQREMELRKQVYFGASEV